MTCTMFQATFSAYKEITRTFDIIWALDAGLWLLRSAAKKYFEENPNSNNKTAKDFLVKDLDIHGLNLKRIAKDLTWKDEEQYIAELLLIYGIAIFDSWVDSIVDTVLLNTSNKLKFKIKQELKQGNFEKFKSQLSSEQNSTLAKYFHVSPDLNDTQINNLQLIYIYFKSCRNCCAHGSHKFTKSCENNYNRIKNLTYKDCGIEEFPKIAETKAGTPIQLILRGIVGFFDILIKIITHYDIVASEKKAIESELIKRWQSIHYKPRMNKYNPKRLNNSIRCHLHRINMYAPNDDDDNNTDQICIFLRDNGLIK